VTGQSPVESKPQRLAGTVSTRGAPDVPGRPGATAFMIGTTVADRDSNRDTQFNRQQTRPTRSLLSSRRRTRRGNNYNADGVPITDLRNAPAPILRSMPSTTSGVRSHTYDRNWAEPGVACQHHAACPGTKTISHGTGFLSAARRLRLEKTTISATRPAFPTGQSLYLGGGGFGGGPS